VVALQALGVAARELNDLNEAQERLEEALAMAVAAGLDHRAASVRSSLVNVLAAIGEPELGLEHAALAQEVLVGRDRADLEMKRAIVLEQMGRLDDASVAYDVALASLSVEADPLLEARLRTSRGVLLVYQHRHQEALADLEQGERLALELGQDFLAGGAAHNLGFAYGQMGDVISSLAAFDRAQERYLAVGFPGRSEFVLSADRCAVLLIAGLDEEARDAAEIAISGLEALHDVNDLAEARLLSARAWLRLDRSDLAIEAADRAAAAFTAAGRSAWAALAHYVATEAGSGRSANAAEIRAQVRRCRRLATDLDQLGWGSESLHVRTLAGRLALGAGDTATARRELSAAAGARHRGTSDRRARAWYATALLRRVDGDTTAARGAVRSGLQVVDDFRATLGASDLRAAASSQAEDLATLGLELAVAGGRAHEVLEWAEHSRAAALRLPPVRPPEDQELSAALGELRRMRCRAVDATLDGDPARFESEIARLERQVRDCARRVRGDEGAALPIPTAASVRSRLGSGRAVVELIEHDERLLALVVTTARTRLVPLGEIAPVVDDKQAALFAMSRLARRGRDAAAVEAAGQSLDYSLRRLAAAVVDPLPLPPTTAAVVVVPTGSLHGVPWSAVFASRGAVVTVAPSVAVWDRAVGADPTHGDGVALIAGPGLPAARREVETLHRRHHGAVRRTGRRATVSETLDLLGSAELVHLAAHGSFRADNPLFSSLELADGSLTVYDIERLPAVPRTVILPACDAAVTGVRSGDELLGTASALIGLGVRSVIAPVTPVSDDGTTPLMLGLHAALASGLRPSSALAASAAAIGPAATPTMVAAASSFICIGTDDAR